MLNTNLLPPEEKRLVWFEETRRIILFFTLFVLVILLMGSILLLPSFLAFYIEQQEFGRSIKLEEEASQKSGAQEILAASQKTKLAISAVKELSSNSQKVSSLLENLLGDADSVILANVDIKKTGEVALSGTAPARPDLLNFEKKLRGSGIFQEISSPLSNIVREVKINFIMQGKLKPRFGL